MRWSGLRCGHASLSCFPGLRVASPLPICLFDLTRCALRRTGGRRGQGGGGNGGCNGDTKGSAANHASRLHAGGLNSTPNPPQTDAVPAAPVQPLPAIPPTPQVETGGNPSTSVSPMKRKVRSRVLVGHCSRKHILVRVPCACPCWLGFVHPTLPLLPRPRQRMRAPPPSRSRRRKSRNSVQAQPNPKLRRSGFLARVLR